MEGGQVGWGGEELVPGRQESMDAQHLSLLYPSRQSLGQPGGSAVAALPNIMGIGLGLGQDLGQDQGLCEYLVRPWLSGRRWVSSTGMSKFNVKATVPV